MTRIGSLFSSLGFAADCAVSPFSRFVGIARPSQLSGAEPSQRCNETTQALPNIFWIRFVNGRLVSWVHLGSNKKGPFLALEEEPEVVETKNVVERLGRDVLCSVV
jgi:hypothetical protein